MKVIRDRFKSWPVTGVVLGMVALGIMGVAYWSSVQDRERYLQSRNFRLLADLSSQVSNLIENRARIFRDTVGDPRVRDEGAWGWQDEATRLMRGAGGRADVQNDLAHAVDRVAEARQLAAHRPGTEGIPRGGRERRYVPLGQLGASSRQPARVAHAVAPRRRPRQRLPGKARHGSLRHARARRAERTRRVRRGPPRRRNARDVGRRDSARAG